MYMAVSVGGGGSVVKFNDIKDTEVVLLFYVFGLFFTYLGILFCWCLSYEMESGIK